jgi:LEA14-like dessication related protein
VALTQVAVRGIGLTGGSLDLVTVMGNPNDIDLRIVAIDAGFDVERGHVGEIHTTQGYIVPAHGTAPVTLPLRFDWSGAGDAFRTALGYGDIPFLFRGQVTLDVAGRLVKIPFTREGRVPLVKGLSIPTSRAAPPITP